MWIKKYTGYFTSDNEPGRIENATHNTLERKPGYGGDKYPAFPPDVLRLHFRLIITRENPVFQFYKYSQHAQYFICRI
jgi:hypothetical protein